MNAHVLITIVSARCASDSTCQPALPSLASITSVSTRFFAHPKLTNATDFIADCLPVIDELQRQFEIECAQRRNDFLKIVLVLARNANLLVLVLRVHFE